MTTVKAVTHHRPPTETISAEVEPNACAPGAISEETLRRSHQLVRRISVLLLDLGLRETLPPDWAVPSPHGVDFRLLLFEEADRLVLTLEDFIRDGRPQAPAPGPNQISFFGGGA